MAHMHDIRHRRRESLAVIDHARKAHAANIHTVIGPIPRHKARALIIADDLRQNSGICDMKAQRYSSYDSGNGARYEAGELSFGEMRDLAAAGGEPAQISGKQELYENIVNDYIR